MSEGEWDSFGRSTVSTWTPPLTFVYGSYRWLNNRPIHYCLTNVSIRNLWDDVRLMQEIPGVEKWGFEALFQRVVREEWVNRIKTRYLGDNERFKFFPPVTIAMLPCQNDVPQRGYGDGAAFSFAAHPDGGRELALSGLKMHFPRVREDKWPHFGEPGLISWDKSQFAALAIDGQHRISALRSFVPRGSQRADQADVPAVILVFDPQLPTGRDLIQVTREIFIDINKNAKTVDDSRLILLDDRNFFNGLTRRMILQAYDDDETPSDLTAKPVDKDVSLSLPDGIPQELVDTAAGRETADATKLKDWHYTSAFILNRALQFFVFENRFEKFEHLVETSEFSIDSSDDMERAVAARAIEYEASSEQEADWDMLSFSPSITEKLVDRAMRLHRALLVGAYTAFKPYAEHVERFRKAANSEDGAEIRSVLLSEGALPGAARFQTSVSKGLESGDLNRFKKIKRAIGGLSKVQGWEKQLVWYSVFQRGVVYQPNLLRTAMELTRKSAFSSRECFAAAFVSALDALFDEGWFSRTARVKDMDIWNGIALKINDNGEVGLDGSDGAARRTGLLVRLLVCSVISREHGGWNHLRTILPKQGISGAVSEVQRGYSRHAKAVDTLSNKIQDDSDYDKIARKHLEALLLHLADPKMIESI